MVLICFLCAPLFFYGHSTVARGDSRLHVHRIYSDTYQGLVSQCFLAINPASAWLIFKFLSLFSILYMPPIYSVWRPGSPYPCAVKYWYMSFHPRTCSTRADDNKDIQSLRLETHLIATESGSHLATPPETCSYLGIPVYYVALWETSPGHAQSNTPPTPIASLLICIMSFKHTWPRARSEKLLHLHPRAIGSHLRGWISTTRCSDLWYAFHNSDGGLYEPFSRHDIETQGRRMWLLEMIAKVSNVPIDSEKASS